jgi:hypothetical protein
MPRTINDIIPPSRRRTEMTVDQAQEQYPTPSSQEYVPPTPAVQPPPSNTTPLPTNSSSIPFSPFTPPPTPPSNNPPYDMSMPPNSTPPPRMRIKVGRSFPYGTAIIALVVIAVCAATLYAFAGAKVEITPASQSINTSGDFSATAGTGDLPFAVITVDKAASVSVPAESTQSANDSAQGSITFLNAQHTPQTLINNTRFATPAGLIFHIHTPVTIPPATANGPGSVTASVYADQPGQSYNVGPTSFTVPGLKGGSSYTLVTAKSSAAMAGGFTGTRASVSQATDDKQHAALQAALATSLQSSLQAKITAGDVLLPGASFSSVQTPPDTSSTTTSVIISETGTMTAVVFPQEALAKAIAYKSAGTYSGEPVTLSGVSGLTLNPAKPLSSDIVSAPTFGFSLSGTTKLIWKVDVTRIAGAVAGKTRGSAQAILQGFPEVDRAVLTLRPFWSSTFPQDPAHIKVTVTNPKP